MNALLNEMREKAREARKNAFALRSEHHIGASVLTSSDYVYAGCNIESNVSGLGICAERNAINAAITNGDHTFKALLIYDKTAVRPCGACMQYLLEFATIDNVDPMIYSYGEEKGQLEKFLLSDLLPYAYRTEKASQKIGSL